MAISSCFFFDSYTELLASGGVKYGSDVIKAYLTNTAPNPGTMTNKSELPEIPNSGNEDNHGLGGANMQASISRVASTSTIEVNNYTYLGGSGGDVGPFRYVVKYVEATGALISWWDYGQSITLTQGDTLAVDHQGKTQDIDTV